MRFRTRFSDRNHQVKNQAINHHQPRDDSGRPCGKTPKISSAVLTDLADVATDQHV